METIEDIKRCVRQYRELDNKRLELNKQVLILRDALGIVKMELTDLVKLPQYSSLESLKIGDNESIKVEKPGVPKPWSLSKKELKEHLENCINHMGGHANADELYDWILKEQSKKVTDEYNFTRIIKE
jgi:hypothetical protein